MSQVRRMLRILAVVTLAVQVALVAASAGAIYVSAAVAEAEADCTCAHGSGVMCPMHHASPNSNECAFRSGPDRGATIPLTSLLGAAGVLPAVADAPLGASALVGPVIDQLSPLDSHRFPPSPPPRA